VAKGSWRQDARQKKRFNGMKKGIKSAFDLLLWL